MFDAVDGLYSFRYIYHDVSVVVVNGVDTSVFAIIVVVILLLFAALLLLFILLMYHVLLLLLLL